MDETILRRIEAQRAEDLARLANRAERAGVRILGDHRTGQHVATDPADPTACHLVDRASCSCRRFAVLGRCPHHALLLAELGLIPDVAPIEAEPEPFDLAAVLWGDAEPPGAAVDAA